MRSSHVIAALMAAAVVGLTACSGSSGRSSDSAGGFSETGGGGSVAAPTAAAGSTDPSSTTDTTKDDQRSIVRTAAVTVGVKDVDGSADRVAALATQRGERVDGDQRSTSLDSRTADLTLRVLPTRLNAVISAVDGLGTETERSITGKDVTATRADINARISALATSVDRLHTFLGQATSVPNLLALEKQLSARQAELDAMRARQRALSDTIDLATLTVHIVQKGTPAAATKKHTGPAGVGSALSSGWHALTISLRWVVATVAYALPVAIVVLLLGLVGIVVRRRVGGRRVSAATPGSSTPSETPAAL